MKNIVVGTILGMSFACFSGQKPQEQQSQSCELRTGKYKVQSANFLRSAQVYELFLIGAESCVQQPVTIKNLQMAQLNGDEGAKVAEFEARADESILYMTKDFNLSLINEVPGEGGQIQREQSLWAPFLAGAAGMVAGQMISNAFFNKPRHYQPPVMQPGQARASGFGGVGDTPEQAKKSYDNTLAKSGLAQDKGLSSSKNAPTSRSRFKKGPTTGYKKLRPRRRPFGIKRRR